MDTVEERRDAIQSRVAAFSVSWLALANLVGLWLAVVLVWPELGALSGRFGYGRWMPLHTDWQLYGWCALPSLGLIAIRYWKREPRAGALCSRAFWLWSSALLVGGASWLSGEAVGKPFLNWSGFARFYLVLALAAIWWLVARSWWNRSVAQARGKLDFYLDGLFLVGLAAVPVALFVVSDATVYPPVNPHSGGATGHSLLLSTLGIVALMGALPRLALGVKRRVGASLHAPSVYAGAFVLSLVAYFSIQHGHVSNREWDQILGLGSLMVWPGLVAWLWRGYEWKRESKVWRGMFFFWWSALAVSGWLIFLPGALEVIKFTNGMVAHAHLAMAGMISALNMLILIEMGGAARVVTALASPGAAWLWNSSLLLFVSALSIQGYREGRDPSRLFLFGEVSAGLYVVRLLAGVFMLYCSVAWVLKVSGLRRRAVRPATTQAMALGNNGLDTLI